MGSTDRWLRTESRLRLKCDGTRAETRFRLSAKRTSPFKSAGGRQFSRLLAAEVRASAVVMVDRPCSDVVCRVLANHSIRQFPFHFPPSVTVCHHVSTGLYTEEFERNRAVWVLYISIQTYRQYSAWALNYLLTYFMVQSPS